MDDLIIIKHGAKGDRITMPELEVGELGYCEDEKVLYIGTEEGNARLCGVTDISRITTIHTGLNALNAKINEITARLDALTPSG